jgi:hypothetical protein
VYLTTQVEERARLERTVLEQRDEAVLLHDQDAARIAGRRRHVGDGRETARDLRQRHGLWARRRRRAASGRSGDGIALGELKAMFGVR